MNLRRLSLFSVVLLALCRSNIVEAQESPECPTNCYVDSEATLLETSNKIIDNEWSFIEDVVESCGEFDPNNHNQSWNFEYKNSPKSDTRRLQPQGIKPASGFAQTEFGYKFDYFVNESGQNVGTCFRRPNINGGTHNQSDLNVCIQRLKTACDNIYGTQNGLEELSIKERYSIALVEGSANATFDDLTKDEVTFDIKIADQSVDDLGSITVRDYENCEVIFDSEIISARADKANKVPDPLDSSYTHVPILVDANTTKFNEGPNGYFTTSGDFVTLKFCVMSEIGLSKVVDIATQTEVDTSISYTKVKIDVTIDMKNNFSTDLEIEEEQASSASKDVDIEYGLDAFECDDTGAKIDSPLAKNQNSMINICISTSNANDVVIAKIKELQLKSDSIASNAINNSTSNSLTNVNLDDKKNVIVTTQMVSAFFADLSPGETGKIDISGTAVMEFEAASGRRSRKVARIRKAGRKLDGEDDVTDAGLGEFKMEVGISGASSEANGAATSGAFTARLSTTPSLAMASLAFGGALIGIMI